MIRRYSLIIAPSPSVIDAVQIMKEELAAKIGWYPSKNAKAHLTLNEFNFEENEIEKVIAHLKKITEYLVPSETIFNQCQHFPNGAFFLAPEENSKIYLKKIMTEVHHEFKFPILLKSNEPHISIGRKIAEENLSIAYQLWPKISFSFFCHQLALRVFNPTKRQFDTIEHFDFQGKQKIEIQTSLF